jgi:hypothetical protein
MCVPHWDREIEFYDDTYYGGPIDLSAMGICGNERDDFHRELLKSTQALEKEIRRRDDEERARLRAEAEQRKAMQAIVERKNKFYDEMKRAGMSPDPELEALLNNLNSFTGATP